MIDNINRKLPGTKRISRGSRPVLSPMCNRRALGRGAADMCWTSPGDASVAPTG